MRYRIMSMAIAFIASALAAAPALALSNVTQLNGTNLDKQDAFNFTIKTEKKDDGIHFHITIEPKGATSISSALESNLLVMDGATQIVSCDVAPQHNGKSVTYDFVVSDKYLEKSIFNFGNMAVVDGKPMPAGDFYWFFLADVVKLIWASRAR
jgi:hypothetical protein